MGAEAPSAAARPIASNYPLGRGSCVVRQVLPRGFRNFSMVAGGRSDAARLILAFSARALARSCCRPRLHDSGAARQVEISLSAAPHRDLSFPCEMDKVPIGEDGGHMPGSFKRAPARYASLLPNRPRKVQKIFQL